MRHFLGAGAAEHVVIAKVKIPKNKIFINVGRGKPTKFAIDSNIEPSDLLRRKGMLIEVKSISDL